MSIFDDETDILNYQIKMLIDERVKPLEHEIKLLKKTVANLEKEKDIMKRKQRSAELWN